MSTEHPILFSGPLVRAILDGRKTQTRRLIRSRRPKPGHQWNECLCGEIDPTDRPCLTCSVRYGLEEPKYKAGDRLWVRETWASDSPQRCAYRADGATGAWMPDGDGGRTWIPHERLFEGAQSGFLLRKGFGDRWRPSIHMPRWASRLSLEVTEVRVQRLQDATPADMIAEGLVDRWTTEAIAEEGIGAVTDEEWRKLWRTHWSDDERGGWDRNPWVWAVSFRRVQG